jgi:hypothetical protein
MAQRHSPKGFQNPFENAGLDKALVEALLLSDEQAIAIALNGLRRAVTKSLHPDRTDGAEIDYLGDFLQATSRILSLEESEQQTLARAYAKQGVRRTVQKPESYTSKDLHDGTLLTSIGDMITDSGESIPSARNKLVLVRPLNYNPNKPDDFTDGPYGWYPPELAKTYLLHIDNEGKVATNAFTQVSRKTALSHLNKQRVTDAEYKIFIKELSEPIAALLEPLLSSTPDVYSNESVVLIRNDDILDVYDSELGAKIGQIDIPDEIKDILVDGMHTFGIHTHTLHDTYYQHDAQDSEQVTNMLVAGTVSSEYTTIEHNRIYKEPYALMPQLPARKLANEQLQVFPVMPNMLKHAEKFYSTSVTKDAFAHKPYNGALDSRSAYVLAVKPNGDFVIVGQIIESLSIS